MAEDGMRPEAAKKIIEKFVKIEPHLIYYVYTCGHAHGPEMDITRRYHTGSVKTLCPICNKGWLVTKYKECGGCGSVSCSLQTRAAPTGICQHCPPKIRIKKKITTPERITSKMAGKKKKVQNIVRKRLYVPKNVKCSLLKIFCGLCMLEGTSIHCKRYDGGPLEYEWVDREININDAEISLFLKNGWVLAERQKIGTAA